MKQVLLVVASQNFQEHEYLATREELEAADIQVVTASDKPGQAIGHDGNKVDVDVTIDGVHPREYDGIFLVGGFGAVDYLNTPLMHKLLTEFFTLGKPYGAICISPRILAQAELLQGKKATGWNHDEKLQSLFDTHSVTFVDEHVVVDDNVVTANGPDAAADFGKAIVSILN
ncbi:MAG: protease I [Alteromonas naphthalenivorans]|jgi:protease I